MAKVSADKILSIARAEIGTKATAMNKCKYNTAFYGYEISASWAYWCAAFVWWVFNKAGAADMLFTKTASCGTLGNAFYIRNKFKTSGFKPGDIVFFHWSGARSESVPITYSLDHVGIIEKVNGDGTVTTIEGNTGDSAYGEVMRRTRSLSVISGVARPDYGAGASDSTVTEPTVKTVQIWLNKTYGLKLDVDGIYGTETNKALVKGLQKVLNVKFGAKLTVDGIFGAKTKAAIRPCKKGDRGGYPSILQAFLICHGYDTGGFDGDFGTQTENAVKAFQKNKGLYVDGIAGKATFAKLAEK